MEKKTVTRLNDRVFSMDARFGLTKLELFTLVHITQGYTQEEAIDLARSLAAKLNAAAAVEVPQ